MKNKRNDRDHRMTIYISLLIITLVIVSIFSFVNYLTPDTEDITDYTIFESLKTFSENLGLISERETESDELVSTTGAAPIQSSAISNWAIPAENVQVNPSNVVIDQSATITVTVTEPFIFKTGKIMTKQGWKEFEFQGEPSDDPEYLKDSATATLTLTKSTAFYGVNLVAVYTCKMSGDIFECHGKKWMMQGFGVDYIGSMQGVEQGGYARGGDAGMPPGLTLCRIGPDCESGRCSKSVCAAVAIPRTVATGGTCYVADDCISADCDPKNQICKPGGKWEGDQCQFNEECRTGYCKVVAGAGYCTYEPQSMPLGATCSKAEMCKSLRCDPNQFICIQGDKQEGNQCKLNEECRTNICKVVAGAGYCVVEAQTTELGEACALAESCKSLQCDPVRRVCIQGTKFEGDMCKFNDECRTNLCKIAAGAGYCAVEAQSVSLGGTCYSGTACRSLNCDNLNKVCIQGTKLEGDMCKLDEECRSNLCKIGAGGASYCAIEPQTLLLGETCYRAESCKSLQCDTMTKKCIQGSKFEGDMCKFNDECRSNICKVTAGAGYCVIEAQTVPLGGACYKGEACRSLNCDLQSRICIQGTKIDGDQCKFGEECRSNKCKITTGAGYCYTDVQSVQIGGSCYNGPACRSLNCDTFSKKCVQGTKLQGDSCKYNDECRTNFCYTGTWGGYCSVQAQTLSIGQTCYAAEACKSLQCNLQTRKCTQGNKFDGDMCRFSDECRSNNCRIVAGAGYCYTEKQTVPIGGSCATADACKSLRCDLITHKCIPGNKRDGDSCKVNDECQSNLCQNWYCNYIPQSVRLGGPCHRAEVCTSSQCDTRTRICIQGTKWPGDYCRFNEECRTNKCYANYCQTAATMPTAPAPAPAPPTPAKKSDFSPCTSDAECDSNYCQPSPFGSVCRQR